MKYKERAELTDNKVAKTLFELMDQKETNLCVAADLTDFSELIELINKIGNEICILKTHIDIIENLPDDFAKQLLELKEKYNF
ncbi:orotidine-5'-phosphate decarboxylase, partial [bacterium]|nr:orotidine-5'-phosphate decarboxylase [bacterium]